MTKVLRRLRALPLFLGVCICFSACTKQEEHYAIDVLNRMTPVKNQGDSQTCWIYAMLAAIETEHIERGDSVNLSAAYVEQMLSREPEAPANKRGMGAIAIALLGRYGVVAYDAMRTADAPCPRYVFMLGAEYTPEEFARSVCAPGEYLQLTSDAGKPYYEETEIVTADNWMHSRFLNVPIDTLLALTERAVSTGRGVCWESRGHAMAVVGLAHDGSGEPYFVMKNSWGSDREYGGLEYVSYRRFRRETLAVEMPKDLLTNKL